jgi:two-component system, LuxR family, sensor kinase FixL
MNTLSIPVVAMASISLYVGLYHLSIYIRRPQYREDLTFALLCFSAVFYDTFCVGLYNATSVSEGVQWQRAQLIALAALVPAFLWFVSDYTHQKPGIFIYASSIYYLFATIVQLVDRSSLTWLVDQPSIKNIILPFGLSVTYYEVTFGIFTTIQSLMGMLISIYPLVMSIRYYRDGHKKETIPLFLGISFMFVAAFHDTLVSNDFYHFIYLMEYAYLGIIVVMAYSLSNMVVEAAIAKDALRKSEERFRSLVETTSDWVWEVDISGTYTYSNPRVRELLGYEPQEIIGKNPTELMLPGEAKRIEEIFLDVASRQKSFERLENTSLRKDGQLVVLETNGVPFFDANGKLLGYRGIDRDITERKRSEKALQESEERYRRLVEVSPIPMWINQNGLITYMNPAALQTLGATQLDQVIGMEALDFIHPDYLAIVKERISHMVVDDEIVPLMEEKYLRLDGSVIDVEVIATPFTTSEGRAMQVFFQDITKRKQTESEREALISDLETKNAELERFTYTVSHDLKSPLVTIKGFLGYIQKDATTGNIERLKGDVQRISDAVDKMRELLNDLLDFLRIGRFVNPFEMVSFEELAREAIGLENKSIWDYGITLELQKNLPVVCGDKQRLIEVLQNLINNAAKFMGHQKNPQIKIGQQGEEDGKPVFFVKDNGIGIASKYHEQVFGLFNKLNPDIEGTGIGLAIVKRIVEAHGGRIWVESEKGKGSTFYFTLEKVDIN